MTLSMYHWELSFIPFSCHHVLELWDIHLFLATYLILPSLNVCELYRIAGATDTCDAVCCLGTAPALFLVLEEQLKAAFWGHSASLIVAIIVPHMGSFFGSAQLLAHLQLILKPGWDPEERAEERLSLCCGQHGKGEWEPPSWSNPSAALQVSCGHPHTWSPVHQATKLQK